MFPLVVIGIIGGYWLAYDGWARVSRFSPSNPLSPVVNAVGGAVDAVSGPVATALGSDTATLSSIRTAINNATHAISVSGVTAHNPAAKADYDNNVEPKLRAWLSKQNLSTGIAAAGALAAFTTKYGIK